MNSSYVEELTVIAYSDPHAHRHSSPTELLSDMIREVKHTKTQFTDFMTIAVSCLDEVQKIGSELQHNMNALTKKVKKRDQVKKDKEELIGRLAKKDKHKKKKSKKRKRPEKGEEKKKRSKKPKKKSKH
jgi:hypothetical protein